MLTAKLELDQQEVNSLSALLDLAVKAGGLQAAGPAVGIMSKLKAAVAACNEEAAKAQKDEKAKD